MTASRILEILDEVRHWLPQQQPIGVFIHHNTLHALENMTFEDAVEYSAARRGCAPYLPLERYQAEFKKGRIDERHIAHALEEYLSDGRAGSLLGGRFDRVSIMRAALQVGVCNEADAAVSWRLYQEKIDTRFFAAIEHKCQHYFADKRRANASPRPPAPSYQTAVDTALIRLSAAYLDQGISYWPIPLSKDKSFLHTAVNLFKTGDKILPAALRWFSSDFNWQDYPLNDVPKLVEMLLVRLGIAPAAWQDFLYEEIMHLPGWAGAMDHFAKRAAAGQIGVPNASLIDFVAVRLLLLNSRLAKPDQVETAAPSASRSLAHCYNMYHFFRELSISSQELAQYAASDIASLCEALQQFDDVARRRVWHMAFERHFRCQILDGLVANAALNKKTGASKSTKYQAIFCIDEREESMRRHIEEISPLVETFGTAGFFGMDMFYQGIHDQQVASLCPIVLTPKHKIREVATPRMRHKAPATSSRLAILRGIAREFYDNSRLLIGGQILTVLGGFFAALPLFFKILLPRQSAKIMAKLGAVFPGELETELHFEQVETEVNGQTIGYKISDMSDRVQNTLKSMGMVSGFKNLVFVFGHGSSSVNNPHKSAYDCGACGGSRGGPNARVFAAATNHPKVRETLRARGIDIPASTHFVGGFHDTSSDQIEYFDVYQIPSTHLEDFLAAKKIFNEARQRNAHERCRRFEDAMMLAPSAALRHVEQRALSLREPRPECGHATNAVCIIGRREMTKHLFLDRRSFLVSYDPTIDPTGDILAMVMGPIIPVCGGINLEYYFSFIDNQIYGCGTKLPHNVTGLIGIIDGHASDLRTGLPWQMVEIHEPMRLIIVMETTRALAEDMLKRNALLKLYVVNRWVQFGYIDCITGKVEWYEEGGFEPYAAFNESDLPRVKNSRSHYYGTLLHLPPVRIAAEASKHGLH